MIADGMRLSNVTGARHVCVSRHAWRFAMSGLLASFLGAVAREVEAFKAVTSQNNVSAVVSVPLALKARFSPLWYLYVGTGLGVEHYITTI